MTRCAHHSLAKSGAPAVAVSGATRGAHRLADASARAAQAASLAPAHPLEHLSTQVVLRGEPRLCVRVLCGSISASCHTVPKDSSESLLFELVEAIGEVLCVLIDVLPALVTRDRPRKVERATLAALPVHLVINRPSFMRVDRSVRRLSLGFALGVLLQSLLEELHLLQRTQPTQRGRLALGIPLGRVRCHCGCTHKTESDDVYVNGGRQGVSHLGSMGFNDLALSPVLPMAEAPCQRPPSRKQRVRIVGVWQLRIALRPVPQAEPRARPSHSWLSGLRRVSACGLRKRGGECMCLQESDGGVSACLQESSRPAESAAASFL